MFALAALSAAWLYRGSAAAHAAGEAELRQRFEATSAIADRATADLGRATADLAAANSRTRATEALLLQAKEDLTRAQERQRALEADAKRLNEHGVSDAAALADLRAQVDERTRDAAELKQRLGQVTAQRDDLQRAAAAKPSAAPSPPAAAPPTAAASVPASTAAATAAEIARLKAELDVKNHQIATAQQQEQADRKTIDDLKSQLDAADKKLQASKKPPKK